MWLGGRLTFCMRCVSTRSRQAPVAPLQALNTISPYASSTDLRPDTIWFSITAVSSYTILGCTHKSTHPQRVSAVTTTQLANASTGQIRAIADTNATACLALSNLTAPPMSGHINADQQSERYKGICKGFTWLPLCTL